MKRLSLIVILVFVAFSACQKDNSVTSNEPTTYKVQGITDVILGDGITAPNVSSKYYTVALNGNIQETVSLSVSGLPSGVYIDTTYRVPTTGIPTFYTRMTIRNKGAAPGTYPVKLLCNGSVTGQKYYTFNIIIRPTPPCNQAFVKTYIHCQNACASGGYYTESITADGTLPNRIYFSNFGGYGSGAYVIYADLDCTRGTINLPTQSLYGQTISGTGSFTAGRITINFTYGIANCNVYIQ